MTAAIDIIALLFLIAGIVVVCEWFTNAVEWLGKLLGLNEGAVGSILAAVGTALPETIVPIIAIVGAWRAGAGNSEGVAVGEGAIMGAPFMLSTLAMFITGVAIIIFVRQGRRTEEMFIDSKVLGRDLTTFLIIYVLAIGVSFLPAMTIVGPLTLKALCGFGFIGAYAWYVKRTLEAPGELGGDIAPLHFARGHETPPMSRVVMQLLFTLAGIMVGAHFFVERIEHLAHMVHIPALILSLIITPIATELPEKMNSVLWVRVKKDTLALGNLTGAMVFQSCIPVAVGMWMTPWSLSNASLLSAVMAILSSAVLIVYLKTQNKLTPFILLSGGFFYVAFLVGLVLLGVQPVKH